MLSLRPCAVFYSATYREKRSVGHSQSFGPISKVILVRTLMKLRGKRERVALDERRPITNDTQF